MAEPGRNPAPSRDRPGRGDGCGTSASPGSPGTHDTTAASERPPLEVARRVVELVEDKKAADIVLLEIAPFTTVADYLVLCSGGSERQLGANRRRGRRRLKHDGLPIVGREGEPASHWVLIDAGAVIVHVFAPPEREYYALEKLWATRRRRLGPVALRASPGPILAAPQPGPASHGRR